MYAVAVALAVIIATVAFEVLERGWRDDDSND
jgi:uncharacterized membrane protein